MIRIGYQGIEGSNNHEISKRFVNDFELSDLELRGLISSQNVVEAIINKEIDIGIMAYRNNNTGLVDETVQSLKMLKGTKFKILKKYSMQIKHYLVCKDITSETPRKRIFAHEQAFKQCKENLSKQFPNLKQEVVLDTALAGKLLCTKKDALALCNEETIRLFGLDTLTDNLADNEDNYSYFIVFTLNPELFDL